MKAGKVGQSLSRCVRDILDGKVQMEDIYVIITRTQIPTRERLRGVMEEYTYRESRRDPTSLSGYDIEEIMTVVYSLWDQGKLHQPRCYPEGHQFGHIAEDVWFDIVPTPSLQSPSVVEAYQHYDMLRKLTNE